MDWHVIKTGATQFDVLHAYGLAAVLACAADSPVAIQDEGITYRLRGPDKMKRAALADLLSRVIPLPSLAQLEAAAEDSAPAPLPVLCLDGLLAALFTTKGPRLVSVVDLSYQGRFRPAVAKAGLVKGASLVRRLVAWVDRRSGGGLAWLPSMLEQYAAGTAAHPVPINTPDGGISIAMTIDPFFSLSVRRPIGNGLISDRTNVTIRGAEYAALLGIIGAARFLRAQRVLGGLVNLYVPFASNLEVVPDTALQVEKYATRIPSEQAIASRWLDIASGSVLPHTAWSALGYQVLQPQGAQQAISRTRGVLDTAWLLALAKNTGPDLLRSWRLQLRRPPGGTPLESRHLAQALLGRRVDDWLSHLREMAIYQHAQPGDRGQVYAFEEVQEVMTAMAGSPRLPLSEVLRRDSGTIRFGRALRLLGRSNRAALRDVIDALDTVSDRDQLVRLLARAMQEFAVAGARNRFMDIPSDKDLIQLLDDVEIYQPRAIASVLIILAALRYPSRYDSDTTRAAPLVESPRKDQTP